MTKTPSNLAENIPLADIGIQTVLYMLMGTSLLGAAVTWFFGIETKGVNLEKVIY